MPTSPPRRLYDPATRARVASGQIRRVRWLSVIVALVSGALIGGLHASELPFLARPLGFCPSDVPLYDCEYPAWLDVAAGALAALVLGGALLPLAPLAGRRIRPSVYCRSCDGMGWMADLRDRGGRCPRCGGERFDLLSTDVEAAWLTGGPLFLPRREVREDVKGADLIQERARDGSG